VVGLVNSSGSKVNSYSYDPYGMQLSATGTVANPWCYAGGQFDSQTGLTKFGARYYDPDLSRFTQRDPSGLDLPYAYAGCDPVNNVDPTGFCTVWTYVKAGIIGAIFGLAVLAAKSAGEAAVDEAVNAAAGATAGTIVQQGASCIVDAVGNYLRQTIRAYSVSCGAYGVC